MGERNCLQSSKRIAVSLLPRSPKLYVLRMSVKKRRQLVHMMNHPILVNQTAKDVERQISEVVHRSKTGK